MDESMVWVSSYYFYISYELHSLWTLLLCRHEAYMHLGPFELLLEEVSI